MAKVIFTSKVDGNFSMHVEGAPGQTCLKVNDNIADVLNTMKATTSDPEPTEEMYATVGKDPEAFNNVTS